ERERHLRKDRPHSHGAVSLTAGKDAFSSPRKASLRRCEYISINDLERFERVCRQRNFARSTADWQGNFAGRKREGLPVIPAPRLGFSSGELNSRAPIAAPKRPDFD